MPSERWLKKVPEPDAPNVSQADVRRVQLEKQRRLAAEPLPETTPVEKATPPQKAAPTPAVLPQPPPDTPPLPETPLLPADAPHLRLPYDTLERLRRLKPAPRVICEEIYRAAAGWHSDECVISIGKLSKHCRLDEKHVRKYLRVLESEGFIKRLGDIVGAADIDSRGIHFHILLPRLTPPQKATGGGTGRGDKTPPNKIKDLKKDSKEPRARVCDRCREWNGFWYPNGFEGGILKCDHGIRE